MIILSDLHQAHRAPKGKTINTPTLHGIPPELRNTIWSMVLPSGPQQIQEHRFAFGITPKLPTLLRVDRQIRNEALGLYYGTAHFELILHWRGVGRLAQWVQSLPQPAVDGLLNNPNVNIRVIFDTFHPDFRAFETDLGSWSVTLGMDDALSWWVSAEHYRKERSPLRSMMDLDPKRKREKEKLRIAGKAQTKKGKPSKIDSEAPPNALTRTRGRKLLRAEMARIVGEVLDVFYVRQTGGYGWMCTCM